MKSHSVSMLQTSTRANPARACRGAPVAVLACLALVLVGCDFPGQRNAQIRTVPADEVLGFDALYATNCAGCHGPDGRLGPAPPLNDPLFLKIVPDAVVRDVIRDGRPGTLMPAFSQDKGGTLTARQMQALTTGLKTHWKPSASENHSVPEYALPKGKVDSSTAAIQRGAQAYERACSGCHGDGGKGDSAGAISDPAFLALLSDQVLRRLIITGRSDLKMPDYAQTDGRTDDFHPLTSDEINDLVAYLRSLEKQPPAVASARVGSQSVETTRSDRTP
jgi:cytochrome c oxidase cbb3-type subunit III